MFLVLGGKLFWRKALLIILGIVLVWLIFGQGYNSSNNLLVMVSRIRDRLPIYSVDTEGEKKVSISFDACWGATRTNQLLETLEQYDVKTTFFVTNIWLEDYPDKIRKIAEAGHEIGLHSKTHAHFNSLSDDEIKKELLKNAEMIEELTSQKPKLFRPPFGEYNDRVIRISEQLGFQPVQWSLDSLDWKEGYDADTIYQRITSRIGPGDIVLFHNDGEYTPKALPRILEWLQDKGYKVVPVSELIWKDDFYIDLNGVQHRKGGS